MDRIVTTWQETEAVEFAGTVIEVSRGELMRLVFDASDRTGWQYPSREASEVPGTVLRSAVLYCLARNICSSEGIVESAASDSGVIYLCSRHSFDWQIIHEFRRRNADVIRSSLISIFQMLARTHDLKDADPFEEAQQRLRTAIQSDSIVLDL